MANNLKNEHGDFTDLGDLLKVMGSGQILVFFGGSGANHVTFTAVDSQWGYQFTKAGEGKDFYEVRRVPAQG